MPGETDVPAVTRILMRASAICGDADAAGRWYANERLSPFRGKTAKELVERDGRAQDVIDYLDHIEGGSLG